MATAFANLECGVCTCYYDNDEHKPKILPKCGHIYGQKCLLKFNEKNKDGDVCCPTCRDKQDMSSYPNGVVDLPTVRFVLEVLDESLCMECGELSKTTEKCPQCPLKSCKACRARHESARHCDILHKLYDTKRHACDEVINRCLDQMAAHDKVDTNALRTEIKKIRKALHAELDARFDEILKRVDTIDESCETLKDALATGDFVQGAKASLEKGVDLDVLQQEVTRMKRLVTSLVGDFDLRPVQINLDSTSVSASIQQFGDFINAEAAVNEKADEHPLIDYQKKGPVKMRMDGTESGTKFDVIFDVAICPLTSNIYVTENNYVRVFSGERKFLSRFETGAAESYITVNPHGQLVLSDILNHRIKIYSARGELLNTFGSNGAGDGQLNYPAHNTCHGDKIYVTDQENHRVNIHNHDGKFISTIGADVLKKPFDIVITHENKIVVSDVKLNQICLFSQDGNLLNRITTAGDRQLIQPMPMCTDRNGHILVVDWCDKNTPACIDLFTVDMNHHSRLVIPGLDNNTWIYGIATTMDGDVILTNYAKKEIIVI